MTQRTFDLKAGEKAKYEGMGSAAKRRALLLLVAREFALAIARVAGTVTADDVYECMLMARYTPGDLGNAAGSIFRGKHWTFTGEWRKSTRVSNHARMIRVWALTEGETS